MTKLLIFRNLLTALVIISALGIAADAASIPTTIGEKATAAIPNKARELSNIFDQEGSGISTKDAALTSTSGSSKGFLDSSAFVADLDQLQQADNGTGTDTFGSVGMDAAGNETNSSLPVMVGDTNETLVIATATNNNNNETETETDAGVLTEIGTLLNETDSNATEVLENDDSNNNATIMEESDESTGSNTTEDTNETDEIDAETDETSDPANTTDSDASASDATDTETDNGTDAPVTTTDPANTVVVTVNSSFVVSTPKEGWAAEASTTSILDKAPQDSIASLTKAVAGLAGTVVDKVNAEISGPSNATVDDGPVTTRRYLRKQRGASSTPRSLRTLQDIAVDLNSPVTYNPASAKLIGLVPRTACPEDSSAFGKDNVVCMTAYSQYQVNAVESEDTGMVYDTFVAITQATIEEGVLQEQLTQADPESVFVVEGASDPVGMPTSAVDDNAESGVEDGGEEDKGGLDSLTLGLIIAISITVVLVCCLLAIWCFLKRKKEAAPPVTDEDGEGKDKGGDDVDKDPENPEKEGEEEPENDDHSDWPDESSLNIGDSHVLSEQEKQELNRKLIADLVHEKCPEEEDNLESLLEQFKGREEALISTLENMEDVEKELEKNEQLVEATPLQMEEQEDGAVDSSDRDNEVMVEDDSQDDDNDEDSDEKSQASSEQQQEQEPEIQDDQELHVVSDDEDDEKDNNPAVIAAAAAAAAAVAEHETSESDNRSQASQSSNEQQEDPETGDKEDLSDGTPEAEDEDMEAATRSAGPGDENEEAPTKEDSDDDVVVVGDSDNQDKGDVSETGSGQQEEGDGDDDEGLTPLPIPLPNDDDQSESKGSEHNSAEEPVETAETEKESMEIEESNHSVSENPEVNEALDWLTSDEFAKSQEENDMEQEQENDGGNEVADVDADWSNNDEGAETSAKDEDEDWGEENGSATDDKDEAEEQSSAKPVVTDDEGADADWSNNDDGDDANANTGGGDEDWSDGNANDDNAKGDGGVVDQEEEAQAANDDGDDADWGEEEEKGEEASPDDMEVDAEEAAQPSEDATGDDDDVDFSPDEGDAGEFTGNGDDDDWEEGDEGEAEEQEAAIPTEGAAGDDGADDDDWGDDAGDDAGGDEGDKEASAEGGDDDVDWEEAGTGGAIDDDENWSD